MSSNGDEVGASIICGGIGAFTGFWGGLGLGLILDTLLNTKRAFKVALYSILVGAVIGAVIGYWSEARTTYSDLPSGYDCGVPGCSENHETSSEASSHNRMYWG
jgi:predicted lipid-binding transport protein (Tim44 family)